MTSPTRARRPDASTASATASSMRYMSQKAVVPVRKHLGAAQHGPQAHQVVGELLFHGEDVFGEPVHERQVVGQPAQERHGDVGMGVDQSGHDHAAAQVQALGGRVCGLDLGARAHGEDGAVVQGQGGVLDDGAFRVLGEQEIAGDEGLAGGGHTWAPDCWRLRYVSQRCNG